MGSDTPYRIELFDDVIDTLRSFDPETQRSDHPVDSVKLLPGQYHAARGPESISTVLGSCVSTCLWDPVERIGGRQPAAH